MPMRPNNELKIHFVNVNHGDATIIEFPDFGKPDTAHFGVVDFGAKLGADRGLTRDYLKSLIELRRNGEAAFESIIHFACVTHPHNDHYGGLSRFLTEFADANDAAKNKIRAFWDCGFRTNSSTYNKQLDKIRKNDHVTFVRLSSGAEFEYGSTRLAVLAPSIDLRNRFDTFGVGKNDASIVLRVKFKKSCAILAADAEYASWGKTTEEHPRNKSIAFQSDALGMADREDTVEQLNCNLLKLAHHGSKHGSSLEYLERLTPSHVVITAGDPNWYQTNVSNWAGKFPHPLVEQTLQVLDPGITRYVTGTVGNVIFKYSGNFSPRNVEEFADRPGDTGFDAALLQNWQT